MILLDYKDRRPLYEQVTERFSELILNGALQAGSQLPSVRSLAVELSINPNTIQRAYAELERRGFIYSVKGRGSFVSDTAEIACLKEQEFLEELKSVIKKAISLGIGPDGFVQHSRKLYEEVTA